MTGSRAPLVARGLVVAGFVGTAAGLWHDAGRTWAGILIASFGLLTAGLGGLFFVALNYACGATWAVAFRRIPEALTALMPVGAAGLVAVFVFRPTVYPWLGEAGHLDGFRGAWLSPGPFFLRAAFYVAVWLAFALAIVRTSRAQDESGAPDLTRRNVRLSIAFIIVFALTFWLASVDWIMSLEPHWYSTIFGVYHFAGLFASTLALVVVAAHAMRRAGVLAGTVGDAHMHDLGKLLFAFTTFWMYIWFSQYMLIWYANIPEGSAYFVTRREGTWLTVFYLNVTLNWVVPFLALLSVAAKRGAGLVVVAAVVLAGRWLDLYQMIWPAIVPGGPRVGLCEMGPLLAAIGVGWWTFSRVFQSAPPVPVREPALGASLHHHV